MAVATGLCLGHTADAQQFPYPQGPYTQGPYPQGGPASNYAQNPSWQGPAMQQTPAMSPVTQAGAGYVPGYQSPAPYSTTVPAGAIAIPDSESVNPIQSLDTPNMIGGSLINGGSIGFSSTDMVTLETVNGSFGIPDEGRIPNIADNNSPIPRDRIYFSYNHFHSAFDGNFVVDPNAIDPITMLPVDPVAGSPSFDQNRFTLGLEKTLAFGDMSVELRVPLVTQVDYSVASVADPTNAAFTMGAEDPTGNVAINFKQVLANWKGAQSTGLLSWGIGLALPTTEGATYQIGDSRFQFDTGATYINPFVAFLLTTERGFFFQGFFDFNITNDSYSFKDVGSNAGGNIEIADYANIDIGTGYWLFRDPGRRYCKGMASIFEVHYTAQTEDTETLMFNPVGTNTTNTVLVNNGVPNRRDITNFTVGVHSVFSDHINVRTAGVFPFEDAPDRNFDASVVVQIDIVR